MFGFVLLKGCYDLLEFILRKTPQVSLWQIRTAALKSTILVDELLESMKHFGSGLRHCRWVMLGGTGRLANEVDPVLDRHELKKTSLADARSEAGEICFPASSISPKAY